MVSCSYDIQKDGWDMKYRYVYIYMHELLYYVYLYNLDHSQRPHVATSVTEMIACSTVQAAGS